MHARAASLALSLPLVVLAGSLGCSKPAGTSAAPTGSASASAMPATPAASASSAPTPTAAAAASASASAAPATAGPTAMEACQRVQKGGLGKICEAKPPIPPSTASVQITFAPSAAYKHETFAAFMTFRSAAELEQSLTAFRAEPGNKKRKPPIFISNAKALVMVVADGEIPDADRFRTAVAAL